MRLKGKQALITGSSRGIGRGIALKLAREGATIAVHYYRNHEAAADTLALIRELGADGIIVRADVSLVDDIRRMFAEVRDTFGSLDIFVGNARSELATFYEPPLDLTLDKWAMAFDSQARAFLVAVQEAAPLMPNGGRILAITFAPGSCTGSWQPWMAMGSAKAALESAVRYFAVALAPRGITVNALSPGLTEDSVLNSLPEEAVQLARAWHRRWTPMGRLGTPADVGNAAALLCSDEAAWITGQVIATDGGASLMDTVLPLELQQPQAAPASAVQEVTHEGQVGHRSLNGKDKQIMKTASAILFAASLLTPAAAGAQPVETERAGVTAELVELRQSGGVLRLAVRFSNGAAETVNFNAYEVGRIVLVDAKSRKKHFPIKDANGLWVAGPIGDDIDGGRIQLKIPPRQTTVVWAYFEPVAAGTVMHVEVPHVFPFENVPVTEGPGKAFASRTARTTPGGGLATLVSAKRGDQVLNVRLRLTAEKEEAELLDAYLRFKHVFLFDPIAKRKYPLIKDSEGDFQGQPVDVKGDGGSFIFDWRKTILVSLTFQAPPDTVQRADLLLPQFLPFEGLTMEGLGGAAVGGTEAAGKSLDLQGAMKELNAEETATEIRIGLAADVLFDFDKAAIKSQAGPTLQNLATVLKANPGAKVAIEGHTDGKGADAYNQTLSEQRAASVKQWLVANAHLDGASIATRGWGKTKPVAHNTKPDGSDDAEGRAKNRRVQIVVRKGGQGGDEPLLALLPKRIAGTELSTPSTPSGGQSLSAGTEEWRNYLASLGKTNADVSRATAVAPAGAALDFKMNAFRVAGLDWGPRLETFQANVAAASRGVVRFEQVALGGKKVRRAIDTGKLSVAPIYYYAAGDIIFSIQSLNEAAVAEALAMLPAGTGATASAPGGATAGAPSGAAGQPGARPIFVLGMNEVACVGRPAILMTKLLDATGVPIPFVTITQIATLGPLTPFEQGPGNDFEAEYVAQRWGSGIPGREGKEEIFITAHYPGGTHSTVAHIDVSLCLAGEWQDGPRTLEITHKGAVVIATIVSGSSSECQQSGIDFSGVLSGYKLTGRDLQICNPKECVPPLPATDQAPYEATVANDAMSIDFTWTRRVGEGCNLSRTVQERFSITRTGPVRRFGT